MAGSSSTTLFLLLVFAQLFSASWATCPFDPTEIWADAEGSNNPVVTNDIFVEFETENKYTQFIIEEDQKYAAMATIWQETMSFPKTTLQARVISNEYLSIQKNTCSTKTIRLRLLYKDGFFNITLFPRTDPILLSLNSTKIRGSGTMTLRVWTVKNSRFPVRVSCFDPEIRVDWVFICIITTSSSFTLVCFGIGVFLLRRACKRCCKRREAPPKNMKVEAANEINEGYEVPKLAPPPPPTALLQRPTENPSEAVYEDAIEMSSLNPKGLYNEPIEPFSKNPASHKYANLPALHCGKSNRQESGVYENLVVIRHNEKRYLHRPKSTNRFNHRSQCKMYINWFNRGSIFQTQRRMVHGESYVHEDLGACALP